MAEADKLYPGYDLPHNNQLTPDTLLAFGGRYIIKRECCRIVLFRLVFDHIV